MIREAVNKEHNIDTKVSAVDLVTETDQAVEKLIFSRLLGLYPAHASIGEESTAGGARCVLTDTPTWIVDPIDGTTNFVHRYPNSCVSIGLAIGKQPAVGVVYNPLLDELFTATRGGGAFLNGAPISVSRCDALRNALLISEFGSDRKEEYMNIKFANMRAVINDAHGLRCVGSAALNLCAIAAGRADAYFEFGIHCWDVAAGALVLSEAGGVVSNLPPNGDDASQHFAAENCLDRYDMMRRQVLGASTVQLAREIAALIKPIEYTPD